MLKIKHTPLFFLIPLYIAWQLMFLLYLDPTLLLTFPEELHRGMMAKEILEGLKGAIWQYRPDTHSGGSVVIGALASLVFSQLGYSLFALKLVPIALFSLALVFWYLVIANYFSQRAAIFFSLLYTFAPFAFTQFCQSHMGDHPETILFTGLSIYLLFDIQYRDKKSMLNYALFGLVAGLGIWFTYIYSLALVSLFIFWSIRDPLFFLKNRFFIFVACFLIGFSPWLLLNPSLPNGFSIREDLYLRAFDFKYLLEFFGHYQNSVPFRFLTSFAPPWMHAPSFLWKMANGTYALFYFYPMVIAFVLNFTRNSKWLRFKLCRPFDFFLIYTVIFFAASQLSFFRNIRFMIPAFPILFTFVAISLDKMASFKDPRSPRIAKAFVSILVIFGLTSNVSAFSQEHAYIAMQAKGYTYYYLGHYSEDVGYHFCQTPAKCLKTYSEFKKTLNTEDLHVFSIALGMYLNERLGNSDQKHLNKWLAQMPEGMHQYFLYTFGFKMAGEAEKLSNILKRLSNLKDLSSDDFLLITQGAMDGWGDLHYTKFYRKWSLKKEKQVPVGARDFFWRAIGQRTSLHTIEEKKDALYLIPMIKNNFEFIPTAYRDAYLEGVGRTIASTRYLEDTPRRLGAINGFPQDWQIPILHGVGMAIESAESKDSWPLMEQVILREVGWDHALHVIEGQHKFRKLLQS